MEDYRYKKSTLTCLLWTEWTVIVFFLLINFLILGILFKLLSMDDGDRLEIMNENMKR